MLMHFFAPDLTVVLEVAATQTYNMVRSSEILIGMLSHLSFITESVM